MGGSRWNLGFGLLFFLLTSLLVGLAFQQLGTPAEMAKFNRDCRRVAIVLRIVGRVNQRSNASAVPASWRPLPESLSDSYLSQGELDRWVDPLTSKPFPYERVSKTRYRMRIDFELSSRELERRGHRLPDKRWNHDAGEHWIEFKVTDSGGNPWEYDGRYE